MIQPRHPSPEGELAAAVARALAAAGLSYLLLDGEATAASGPSQPLVVVVVTDRGGAPSDRRLRSDGVTVDLESRTVERNGHRVPLTRREWTLLDALAEVPGRVVTTDALLKRLGHAPEARGALYTTLHRLRQKIEVDPNRPVWIATVPGVGLRLEGR